MVVVVLVEGSVGRSYNEAEEEEEERDKGGRGSYVWRVFDGAFSLTH